jgi:hypothetical protein
MSNMDKFKIHTSARSLSICFLGRQLGVKTLHKFLSTFLATVTDTNKLPNPKLRVSLLDECDGAEKTEVERSGN